MEQNIIRKDRVDKKVRQKKFNISDNDSGEYKIEAIWDSAIYAKELKTGHLPGLYYLILWKRYLKEKNT